MDDQTHISEQIDDGTFRESVRTLLRNAPPSISSFLTDPKKDELMFELSHTYSLHVDQAGKLEIGLTLMLLGVSSPAEFVVSLEEAGIPRETIDSLVKAVNDRVFIPIRDEEIAASEALTRPAMPPPKIEMRAPPPPPANLPGSQEMAPRVPPVQNGRTLPVAPADMSLPATPAPTPLPPLERAQPAATPQNLSRPVLKEYGVDPYREMPE